MNNFVLVYSPTLVIRANMVCMECLFWATHAPNWLGFFLGWLLGPQDDHWQQCQDGHTHQVGQGQVGVQVVPVLGRRSSKLTGFFSWVTLGCSGGTCAAWPLSRSCSGSSWCPRRACSGPWKLQIDWIFFLGNFGYLGRDMCSMTTITKLFRVKLVSKESLFWALEAPNWLEFFPGWLWVSREGY